MIKRMGVLTAVGVTLLLASETECWGQFGGYHRSAVTRRNVNVARGVNVGTRGAAYRPGGYRGVGYGGYGGYGVFPHGTYVDGMGAVILPPNPGQAPVGIENVGSDNKEARNLRGSSKSALNDALNQRKLPSDAGLPAAKPAATSPKK